MASCQQCVVESFGCMTLNGVSDKRSHHIWWRQRLWIFERWPPLGPNLNLQSPNHALFGFPQPWVGLQVVCICHPPVGTARRSSLHPQKSSYFHPSFGASNMLFWIVFFLRGNLFYLSQSSKTFEPSPHVEDNNPLLSLLFHNEERQHLLFPFG